MTHYKNIALFDFQILRQNFEAGVTTIQEKVYLWYVWNTLKVK